MFSHRDAPNDFLGEIEQRVYEIKTVKNSCFTS